MGQLKHHVIENMRGIERQLGPRLHEGMTDRWSDCAQRLGEAAEFHLEIGPGEEHAQFGSELFDRAMFRLPFPATYFTATGCHFSLLATERSIGGIYCLDVVAFCEANAMHLPILAISALRENHRAVRLNTEYIYKCAYDDLAMDITEDDFAKVAVGCTFGATVLLMSKDATVEVVPAPYRLNADRLKKGRIPINERRVIKIRPEAREAARRAAEAFRSSPAMHWRRGHFRRVREDLIVPVAPTIVGVRDAAKPAIKDYVFKGGSDAGSC